MPFTVQTGGGLQQGSTLATQIQTAIDNWNAKFPGIIKARTNEVNYVTFRFEDGVCSSDVGRQGGQQFINLGNGCAAGNVMHEIAHAMGFHHEHTRPDRGNFVTINWGNIKWFKGHNFEIPSSGESAASGAYDFGSIMHYAVDAFSSNGQNTITINSPVPAGVTVGQRNDFSSGDETAIRKLYCGPVTANGPATMEFEPEGGATGFIISVPPYCTWTATSTQPWIKLTGIISGTGSKYITFSVQPNTGKYPRSGSITYQGRSTVIKQAGSWTNSKLD
jgi:astacin